jgi:hypothetical protein
LCLNPLDSLGDNQVSSKTTKWNEN